MPPREARAGATAAFEMLLADNLLDLQNEIN